MSVAVQRGDGRERIGRCERLIQILFAVDGSVADGFQRPGTGEAGAGNGLIPEPQDARFAVRIAKKRACIVDAGVHDADQRAGSAVSQAGRRKRLADAREIRDGGVEQGIEVGDGFIAFAGGGQRQDVAKRPVADQIFGTHKIKEGIG